MVSITIDCEEWNSPYLRGKEDSDNFSTAFSREGNMALLALFAKHDIKATFFITGFFAQREPENVRQILKDGHEIACHGYEHHYRNRSFDIEKDVIKAKEILEQITQKKIKGFRAPQATYSEELLRILDKCGFIYDSSLHPAYLPGYYNNRKAPLHIHKPLPNSSLLEIPVAVMPKTRLPIVWMFMRNIGVWWTQRGINALVKRKINPVIYVHSWEFVPLISKGVPFYFKRKTGEPFLKMLEKFIILNKKRGQEFYRLDQTIV